MATITSVQEAVRPLEALQMRLQPNTQVSPSAQAIQKRSKIKLDPLRALEPVRKKLSTVEAQRIMSALEDTKRKAEFVALLPHITENIEKYSSALGHELTALLVEHKNLSQEFSKLEEKLLDVSGDADIDTEEIPASPDTVASRPVSSRRNSITNATGLASQAATPAPSEINSAKTGRRWLKLQVHMSIKNILRLASLNPGNVNMIMREAAGAKSRESAYLVQNINDLRDILMEKLLMSPLEEKEKMHYLSQVSAQERNNAIVIEKLEEELRLANEEKDKEIRTKNAIISKLQNDLHILEKATEEEIRRTKTEAEKQEAADSKNSEGKRQKLLTELNQLKAQQQNLTTEHREEEELLRRKKVKIETEVENWIQKYDSDLGKMQDDYEEIDGVYTHEKKQLHDLEEKFKTIEGEYKTITEAKTKAKEEREASERQMALMIRAATTIQAVWRSYKVRKALKQKNKKGKKKGK